MAIFNSYVSLPEGTCISFAPSRLDQEGSHKEAPRHDEEHHARGDLSARGMLGMIISPTLSIYIYTHTVYIYNIEIEIEIYIYILYYTYCTYIYIHTYCTYIYICIHTVHIYIYHWDDFPNMIQ